MEEETSTEPVEQIEDKGENQWMKQLMSQQLELLQSMNKKLESWEPVESEKSEVTEESLETQPAEEIVVVPQPEPIPEHPPEKKSKMRGWL